MRHTDLTQDLSAINISQNQSAMLRFVDGKQAADIADVLAEQLRTQTLADKDVQALLMLMPIDARARIFGYLPIGWQLHLATRFEPLHLAELMTHMPHDDRADLFNYLSRDLQNSLLKHMDAAEREDMQRLASYAEGSIGAVMTSDFVRLAADWSAERAIAHVRRVGRERETIYQAYVLDDAQKLLGTVSLQDLIMAQPNAVLADIMTRTTVAVYANQPQEEAAVAISRYDLLAVPVLDDHEHLVGIVTYDDAMDVTAEEVSTDFRKVGAVGNLKGSLKDASIRLLYKKRVFWLVLLVFGNIFSGAGIAYFEDTIAAYIALVFFLPLLVDSGGNAGSQSATLMVRALATGEVMMKDWASMLGRELAVAGLLGATMAVAVSLLGIWRGGYEIALVVALTMQIVVVVGSVIGMSLPFLLNKLKFDPATASAPLITSIADACGVLIYFAMATWILDIPAVA